MSSCPYDISLILGLVDLVYVLASGQVIGLGHPAASARTPPLSRLRPRHRLWHGLLEEPGHPNGLSASAYRKFVASEGAVMTSTSTMTVPTYETNSKALLEVHDLECGYGPIQVLFGASVNVRAGERVAVLGTNGAGKSTLMRAVAGLIRPSAGHIYFKGLDVTKQSPLHLVGMGLTYMAGGRATFPSLTVTENLKMSAYLVRRNRAEVAARLEEAFVLFPRLRERMHQKAGTLSGGEQQMVAIGRALVSQPDLLMIDELSLGLAPIMLRELQEMISALAARGMAMLIVEQSLNIAAKIADRAYFMEKGEVRFEGDIDELASRGDLVRSGLFGGLPGSERTAQPGNGPTRR